MKQNSSILFHSMRKLLINSYLQRFCALAAAFVCISATGSAVERPEYLDSFDPAKGFKVSVKPSATSGGRHRCQKVGAYDIHI